MFYLGRLVSETEREQRDNAGDRKDTVKTIASGIPFHNLDFYGITRLHVAAVEKLEQLGCLYLKKWVVDAFLKNFGWQTAESWNMGKDQAIFCFMLGYSAYIDIDIVDNDINDIDDVDDIDDIDDIDDVDDNIDNTDN
jgi:hypothetical protein